jgi:hypothetical protein
MYRGQVVAEVVAQVVVADLVLVLWEAKAAEAAEEVGLRVVVALEIREARPTPQITVRFPWLGVHPILLLCLRLDKLWFRGTRNEKVRFKKTGDG